MKILNLNLIKQSLLQIHHQVFYFIIVNYLLVKFKKNPVVAFSKRVNIKLSSTTSATIAQGEQVTQTSATGVVNTGRSI